MDNVCVCVCVCVCVYYSGAQKVLSLTHILAAQSAGAVEHAGCISAKG